MSTGSPGPRWCRPVAIVAAALIAVFLLLTGLLIGDGVTDDLRRTDVAIVLGNTVQVDGRPSPRLEARLERAAELYRADYCDHLIVSGALGKEGHDEAVVMRDWLVAAGIPSEAIVVDSDGWTTGHTARNGARIMAERGWHSATIVTAYFHVPRSKLALHRAGIDDIAGVHARHLA